MRWFTLWKYRRELDRALGKRRIVRKARAASAKAGQSTYWKRAGASCRAMFGEQA